MNVLFFDLMQNSDAPSSLISGSLADVWNGSSITVTLSEVGRWNSVGIARTDATYMTINGYVVDIDTVMNKGLYMIPEQNSNVVEIVHDGTYVGRIGVGVGHSIGIGKAAEPGFDTTNQMQSTEGGQVVHGAGGYSFREQNVDIRYGITRSVFDDFERGFASQIARNYPLFVYFGDESNCLPWVRFYGVVNPKSVFQSSVNYFLYSKRWKFVERF